MLQHARWPVRAIADRPSQDSLDVMDQSVSFRIALYPVSADHAKKDSNDGDHQQDVDQAAATPCSVAEKADRPDDHQDHGN
jgi:hypothetical protein